jgi:hypothetical protein
VVALEDAEPVESLAVPVVAEADVVPTLAEPVLVL